MASLTQLENFETAITAIDPTITVYPTIEKDYITLSLVAPTEALPKYALTKHSLRRRLQIRIPCWRIPLRLEETFLYP